MEMPMKFLHTSEKLLDIHGNLVEIPKEVLERPEKLLETSRKCLETLRIFRKKSLAFLRTPKENFEIPKNCLAIFGSSKHMYDRSYTFSQDT